MRQILQEIRDNTMVLSIFALIGTLLLAWVFLQTRASIQHSEDLARLALLQQVMPDSRHDNDLLKTTARVAAAPLLGTHAETAAWLATRQGKLTGVVLETIAHDGYSGDIRLLVGITAEGNLSGVRVVAHHETPGLGDYIDIAHSNWIRQFVGHSLSNPSAPGWKVKKDGGTFDYMAGATITPRAIVKAVHQALRYFAEHQAEWSRSVAGAAMTP